MEFVGFEINFPVGLTRHMWAVGLWLVACGCPYSGQLFDTMSALWASGHHLWALTYSEVEKKLLISHSSGY
jgi:hypothetical protein